jgi:hypothetical protein
VGNHPGPPGRCFRRLEGATTYQPGATPQVSSQEDTVLGSERAKKHTEFVVVVRHLFCPFRARDPPVSGTRGGAALCPGLICFGPFRAEKPRALHFVGPNSATSKLALRVCEDVPPPPDSPNCKATEMTAQCPKSGDFSYNRYRYESASQHSPRGTENLVPSHRIPDPAITVRAAHVGVPAGAFSAGGLRGAHC